MVKIELDVIYDDCRLKGIIKTQAKEASLPQICAGAHALTEAVIENFQIPEDLKDIVRYFLSSELQKNLLRR